ncbi:MAG: hypothetical protein GXX95_00790 [Methanomassiliicoccus sp.]|nr:hypothetical protein [Methanomassiliicoccus sp.]
MHPHSSSQGSQGLQGSHGLQGSQGLQGSHGLQGSQGLQGSHGLQGSQGLQGSHGSLFPHSSSGGTSQSSPSVDPWSSASPL